MSHKYRWKEKGERNRQFALTWRVGATMELVFRRRVLCGSIRDWYKRVEPSNPAEKPAKSPVARVKTRGVWAPSPLDVSRTIGRDKRDIFPSGNPDAFHANPSSIRLLDLAAIRYQSSHNGLTDAFPSILFSFFLSFSLSSFQSGVKGRISTRSLSTMYRDWKRANEGRVLRGRGKNARERKRIRGSAAKDYPLTGVVYTRLPRSERAAGNPSSSGTNLSR